MEGYSENTENLLFPLVHILRSPYAPKPFQLLAATLTDLHWCRLECSFHPQTTKLSLLSIKCNPYDLCKPRASAARQQCDTFQFKVAVPGGGLLGVTSLPVVSGINIWPVGSERADQVRTLPSVTTPALGRTQFVGTQHCPGLEIYCKSQRAQWSHEGTNRPFCEQTHECTQKSSAHSELVVLVSG